MKLLHEPVVRGPLRVFSPRGVPDTVALAGVLREPDPESWLRPLMDDLHARANADGIATLTLDLRELQYANAAAWRCIVYWIRLVREPSCRYRLRILGADKHTWQKVGMASLTVFTSERLEVVMSHS